ncbi:murein DD-endopeptidase MepM/ murein hydrolase activator NlpD [Humibacillus xanthopallidus]|uniref:Murein DD-endopeptidase MepM/ murein hydrolase activator NlpD n=2 Tax=Humibacillus xanthopallidus TaxID=412689 RepID=A0A543PXS7_9MICO|nr:murein DD-endopeptidase MepM/ murein hydrolase activator NlpD [Humibacillus xanthopallidus]
MTGGLVIRDAGASELSPEAAAMKNVSNTVAGLGLAADPSAVAAAAANRSGARSSRDLARDAKTLIVSASIAGNETAAQAKAKADQAAAEKAAQAKAKAQADAKAKADAKKRALAVAHRWVMPVSGYTLTSGFGFRWGKMHPAQDLACPVGTPVHALSSGTVIFAGWSNEGYGYMVKIQYWDGTVSWMAHNSRLLVSLGDKVVPGQTVSYSGSTGNSTGPHVHLEIHPGDGSAVAPRTWLAKRGVQL